tara:strand:+ start:77 stop:310 length:234 start_codon:yes stop_codon:yes gene_type:complete
MEFWKIVSKVIDVINTFLVILILFGIVLSSNIRSNIYGPGEVQFISAILGTLLLALLSWFLIERPSLRLKTNALGKN